MERVAILKQWAAAVAEGGMDFPTSVHVALKLRQQLDDPDCTLEDAARLVQAEPLLAARVVAMANSAAFNRSGRMVTDVRTALSLLGFKTVRNLAMALVARQMAQMPTTRDDKERAARLWEYTANVASLARVIARRVTHLDPETAMFAGIVHDVGSFFMLARAASSPGLLDDGLTDDDIEGEQALGRAVLTLLDVPAPVLEAVEVFWSGYLAMPPSTLGDTLLLASALSPVRRPLSRIAGISGEQLAASMDMVIGQETLVEILHESRDEIDSLLSVLNF